MIQRLTIQHHQRTLEISLRVAARSDRWLLLLHGLQSDRTLFDAWFTHPQFSHYSLVACDLVGFGASDRPQNFSYDIADHAAVVVALLNALHITSVTVIGHSLGGMIGTLLLQSAPEKICGLISLEGNLRLADCGASKKIAQGTAASIVRWARSEKLWKIFCESLVPRALLTGERSHFASRPCGKNLTTYFIPDASHFMLQEQPETTMRVVAEWLQALCT